MRRSKSWGLILGLLFPFTALAFPVPMKSDELNRYANAIWWTEGGPNTHYPYGIKSIFTFSRVEAREICINTIQHAWKDWQLADYPKDFVTFLADRYCPSETDPSGHIYWVKNVRWFLKHPKPLAT